MIAYYGFFRNAQTNLNGKGKRTMSFDRLIAKIISMKNPTVAGLDPKLEYVPEYIRKSFLEEDGETLKAAAKAIFRYNQMLIDALCDIVPAVKLQAAYYEMYGHHGVKTMERTIRYAKLKGMYVITDAPRYTPPWLRRCRCALHP